MSLSGCVTKHAVTKAGGSLALNAVVFSGKLPPGLLDWGWCHCYRLVKDHPVLKVKVTSQWKVGL